MKTLREMMQLNEHREQVEIAKQFLRSGTLSKMLNVTRGNVRESAEPSPLAVHAKQLWNEIHHAA